ncbi:MAG: DUF3343 domain-containing protein [Ruminococcaceae bacterium]|nr:DUF3343 domain-containing protein [Oscillospiraceae bacterium]
MDNVLILLASITSANRLVYLLAREYGVHANVIQTPKAIATGGCSYCVRVRREYLQKAWDLVKKLGASTKGAFDERDYSRLL